MESIPVRIDRKRVAEFCARHHIRRLALFVHGGLAMQAAERT